jgi:hypothetical protein
MMDGMLRGGRATRVLQRIDRPEVIGLSVVLATLAAVGWLVAPFWLAVIVAGQLLLAGIGAVRLIGPAGSGLGFARYATPAMAAVALTLFGRLIPPGTSLLLMPVGAVLLWSLIWLELRVASGVAARTMLDLALVGIVFMAAAGIWHLFGSDPWPPPLALILVPTFVLAVRAAEARATSGIQAVGQALLHALAVGQVGAAVLLLGLPGVAAPALVALAFYAWAGAVEAVEEGSSLRGVALEFGTIGVLGLIVAFLLHRLG